MPAKRLVMISGFPLPTAGPNPLPTLGGGGSSSVPSIRSMDLWETEARINVFAAETC
jgi:hypothetical protein